jgi:hypothetical protein
MQVVQEQWMSPPVESGRSVMVGAGGCKKSDQGGGVNLYVQDGGNRLWLDLEGEGRWTRVEE